MCHLCNIVAMMMKKALAVSMALSAGLALAACGNDEEDSSAKDTSSSAPAAEQGPTIPTAAELAETMNRAVDPNVPTEEKVDTVVGGESAPQIFDALTAMRAESGAELQVVDPVLPGIIPTQANATMTLTTPPEEPIVINDVQFVHEEGKWKLDQKWACTLIQNVLPDQLPEMCLQFTDGAAPAPEEAPAPAPEEAPAPAPEEAPAPAPEEAPAP